MKFRTIPESLEEMLSWGMINMWVYKKVRHLPFEQAQKVINDEYGTQSWSFGMQHIKEYVNEYKIDLTEFTKHEWITHILRATKGKINPCVVAESYEVLK